MSTGRMVWYELLTTDPQAAIAFYTDVFGWKVEAFGDYPMFASGQGPLGGVTKLPAAALAMGAVPYWQGNVTVADVDAAAKQVEALGGKVYVREDVPDIGRFAVVGDPYGAVIALYTPTRETEGHDRDKHGEVGWHELYTKDNRAAFEFYRQIVGWDKIAENDLGPAGVYIHFGRGGKALGGMMQNPVPPSWMYYVTTEDFDAAFDRAKARGAQPLFGPMPIPAGRRVVAMKDPQGAAFAMITPPT